MDTVEEKRVGKYTVKIYQDEDGCNPREWDNLGTMYYRNRDYILGDVIVPDSYYDDKLEDTVYLEGSDPAEYTRGYIEQIEGDKVALMIPLEIYDHSGVTMWAGHNPDHPDYQWDCSHVGYIAVTYGKLRKEYSKKRISKAILAKAEKVLRQEVETFNDYLTGNCYGYVVEDEQGKHIDSCWGFLGDVKYAMAMDEGISIAEWHVEDDKKKHEVKVKTWIKNKVPLFARV